MKQIFCDKNGDLSSKRIAGAILILAAIAFTFFERGEIDLVKTMFYAGMVCLGVTAFEKKL